MTDSFKREKIGENIYFGSIRDMRFKTNLMTVNLILPLRLDTMTENALIPLILEKGYEDYPTFQAFSKKLNMLYGASAGSSVSKIGDNAVISLTISAIDDSYALNKEELLRESAEILMGMLLHPIMKDAVFAPDTFSLQKQYLIDTIEAEINDKRRYAVMRTLQLMFLGEPFGENKYGTIEQAKQITVEQATAAYHRMIDEAAIEIIHVGMGDPTDAKRVCEKAFSSVKRYPSPPISTDISGTVKEICNETEHLKVIQSKLCFGFKTDITPDSPLLNPMRMAVAILGGTPMSKLFLNVREKKSLCYYCAARFDRTKGIMMIDSGVEHDKIDEAKKAILEQLQEVCRGDFTDADIEFAALNLQNNFHSIGESAYALELFYLTQTVLGISETPEQQSEQIAKVTREQIIAAANQIHLSTVYLLTDDDTQNGKEEIGA